MEYFRYIKHQTAHKKRRKAASPALPLPPMNVRHADVAAMQTPCKPRVSQNPQNSPLT